MFASRFNQFDWRRVARILFDLGALIAAVVVLVIAWPSLTWFVIGLVLAYVFLPLVNVLNRVMPRRLAAVLVVLLMLLIIFGLIAFVIPMIIEQLVQLYNNLPEADDLRKRWADFYQWYMTSVPLGIRNAVTTGLEKLRTQLETNMQDLATSIGSMLANVATTVFNFIFFLVGFVVVPFWLFELWSLKGEGRRFFNRLVPKGARMDFWNFVRLFDRTFSNYLRGQLLLGLVVGCMVGAGLLILNLFGYQVRYILLLAIIAGFTELIPYIGPIIGMIPAVIVAIVSPHDPLQTTLLVVVVYMVVQQLENSFLVPSITGDSVEIHPAVLTVLLIAGGYVFGVMGSILAAPVAAMLRDYFLYIRCRLQGGGPREVYRQLKPPLR